MVNKFRNIVKNWDGSFTIQFEGDNRPERFDISEAAAKTIAAFIEKEGK